MTVYFSVLIALLCVSYLAALRWPGIAVGIGFSMFATEQLLQQQYPIFLSRGTLYNGICAAVVCLSVAGTLLRRKGNIQIPKTWLLTSFLYLFAATSAIWSANQNSNDELLTTALPYTLIFGLAMPLLVYDETTAYQSVKTITILGGFVILGHWFTNYGVRGVVVDVFRGKVVEANPLAVASFSGMVATCAAFLSLRTKNILVIAILLSIGLLSMAVIVRSGSRGQLAAILICLAIGIPAIKTGSAGSRSILFALLGAIALPLGYFLVSQFDFASRWDTSAVRDATEARWSMLSDALSLWLGSGLFSFFFGAGIMASQKTLGQYAHNLPVDIIYEEGIVGFTLFILALISAFGPRFHASSFSRLPRDTRLVIGVFSSLVIFEFITSLKQGALYGQFFLFALLIILSTLTATPVDERIGFSGTLMGNGGKRKFRQD